MLAKELKYGPTFIATGIETALLTARQDVDVLLLDFDARFGAIPVGM